MLFTGRLVKDALDVVTSYKIKECDKHDDLLCADCPYRVNDQCEYSIAINVLQSIVDAERDRFEKYVRRTADNAKDKPAK